MNVVRNYAIALHLVIGLKISHLVHVIFPAPLSKLLCLFFIALFASVVIGR